MSVQFLGLASGTDWNQYIDQLVQIESRTMNKLIERRDKLQSDRSILNTVNQQLLAFDSKLSNLRFESTFLSRMAESSNPGRVSAVAQPGAALGTYTIEINRLARASRATSGLDGQIYSKVTNLSATQTMGINGLIPYDDFQPTRALGSTLIKDTQQAGQAGAQITAGDTISISGTLKDGVTDVSGTFTFNGDETDTLERLATTIAQVFQGELGASVGSDGELVFIETDPSTAGDVTFNTTIPPLDLQFNDVDYSGSTLTFGIGNELAGAGATARRLVDDTVFTVGGVPELAGGTDLATLDQVTGTLDNGDIVRITGTDHNGASIGSTDFTYTGAAGGQTIDDLIATIGTAFGTATATYENGRIVLTDDTPGASGLSLQLEFVDQGASTDFELGNFDVGEAGRDATAQMITTAGFTVEGQGEHLLSSTDGKAGQITGTLMITDPSNTLESWMTGGTKVYDMLTIDPDGAGSQAPIRITGINEYSTVQDLIDAINAQVPTLTAQLVDNGGSYNFQITANQGGQDFRVYDDANGLLQILGPGNPTDIDTSVPDTYSTSATTDTDDVTMVDWFQPNNGGPLTRRVWTGDETVVQGLIGGVAISPGGAGFTPGVATIVTTNSAELNTQQDMYTYVFGSPDAITSTPTHYPPFDPALTLAEAGFATTPQNASDNPVYHTDGFFTINGVQINVGDVNTMTVNELLGEINTSGAGVRAFFDAGNGRFYFRSNTAGPQTVTLGGGGDTSNFLGIAGLTAAAGATTVTGQQKGNIDTELPLAEAGFAADLTSGVFTINDTKITIDTGVDTLSEVLDKINRSGAGVIASYDPVADRITLAQDLDANPTAFQISMGDPADTSNFLEAAQLTVDTTVPTLIGSVRQTAEFSVNGITYTRASNKVSDVIDKVELTLNSTTDGPETITISGDTDRLETAIIDFIAEYNKTMEMINGKPLSKEERTQTADLTDAQASNMSVDEIEKYLTQRDQLLIRDYVSTDSSVRSIAHKIINLIQGPVDNDGEYKSLSQLGLTTSEVGGGPDAVAVMQGRLLAPTSDRDTITQLVESNADLQEAIRSHSDELYTLFANIMESRLTHQGSRDLSGGISVSDGLSFTIGDGENTATVNFTPGTYSQASVLNSINQQLLNAGMSSTTLAYYNANNQLDLRVAQQDTQSYLELRDLSSGADSLLGTLGWQSGIFLGPDPQVSGGVALRTRKYLSDLTTSGGIMLERLKQNGSYDRQLAVYNDAIQRQQDYLTDYEQRLRDKFGRLETQLSELQSQSAAIQQAIATMNAQTGVGNSNGGSSG